MTHTHTHTHTYICIYIYIYICRTAPLTSRCCILYIYSTNIRTLDFKLSPWFEYCIYSLGISPASNCSWPTFRNPVSVPSSKAGCRLSTSSLWRWNWRRVPKRRPTTIWRRGNTQKNIYNGPWLFPFTSSEICFSLSSCHSAPWCCLILSKRLDTHKNN